MPRPEVVTDPPVIHISMDEYLAQERQPSILEMDCGCKEGTLLVYENGFHHRTYTLHGEVVEVSGIPGYKCNHCGLVVFLPEVGDELYSRIEAKRSEMGL